MITKAVIALILFGLTSSANAMTVIFKDYKAATSDEKELSGNARWLAATSKLIRCSCPLGRVRLIVKCGFLATPTNI